MVQLIKSVFAHYSTGQSYRLGKQAATNARAVNYLHTSLASSHAGT